MFETRLKEYGNKLEIKGRKEEKKETAVKMLNRNYPIEEISEMTGLSIGEIKSLKVPQKV